MNLKNILQENMRRFKTKNLNETDAHKLTKKILIYIIQSIIHINIYDPKNITIWGESDCLIPDTYFGYVESIFSSSINFPFIVTIKQKIRCRCNSPIRTHFFYFHFYIF